MEKTLAVTEKVAVQLVLKWIADGKLHIDSYHTGGHALHDFQKKQGLVDPESFDPICPTEEEAVKQLSNCGGDHPLMTAAFAIAKASETRTFHENDTSNCLNSSLEDLCFNVSQNGKEPTWKELLMEEFCFEEE